MGKLQKRKPKSKTLDCKRGGFKASRHYAEEFGLRQKDVIFCSECNAVYYYKSWHHNLRNYRHLSEEKNVNFIKCPACAMWKNHQWEGEIHINGIPKEKREEIKNSILNFGNEAYKRDPMDRVYDIKESGEKIIVFTSENQLANRIAKKLSSSFKKRLINKKLKKGKGGDWFVILMEWEK